MRTLNRIPTAILIAVLGALVFAYIAQYALGVEPCSLCIYQRYAFATVMACAFFAALSKRVYPAILLIMTLVAGLSLSVYHVGVENKLWPAPARCASATLMSATQTDLTYEDKIALIKEQLSTRKPVACDQVNWRILGVSVTVWIGLLWSLLVTLGGYHLWITLRKNKSTL
jgi:disulfide bond formation protein DsbB